MYTGPQILTNNLIMYLDSDSTKSYPTSGTTWFDRSGNGNHGILANSEYVSGNVNYLQNLGNVTNFFAFTIADSPSLSSTFSVITGGWTIEEVIWTNSVVYPECDAGSVISTQATTDASTGFDWNHGTSNTSFQFGMNNSILLSAGTYDVQINFAIPAQYNYLNGWKLRTMIWDRTNNTCSLYINGAFINSGSSVVISGLTVYDGGGMSIGTLYGWKHFGRRGLFKVYNKVLTPIEIRQNYDAIKSRYNLL